ncbi:hypothetical protein ALC56_08504, partial [Trachymyrmex septentrionalis]
CVRVVQSCLVAADAIPRDGEPRVASNELLPAERDTFAFLVLLWMARRLSVFPRGQRTCIICEKKRNSFTPTVFGVAVRAGRVGNDVGFDRQQNCWTDDIGAKRHDCLSSVVQLCTRALAT